MTFGEMMPASSRDPELEVCSDQRQNPSSSCSWQRFGADTSGTACNLARVGRLDPKTHVDKRSDFFCSSFSLGLDLEKLDRRSWAGKKDRRFIIRSQVTTATQLQQPHQRTRDDLTTAKSIVHTIAIPSSTKQNPIGLSRKRVATGNAAPAPAGSSGLTRHKKANHFVIPTCTMCAKHTHRRIGREDKMAAKSTLPLYGPEILGLWRSSRRRQERRQ